MEIYNLELKQKVNKNFLKTVSAFANYNDGSIFFGINNDGGIFGLEENITFSLPKELRIHVTQA